MRGSEELGRLLKPWSRSSFFFCWGREYRDDENYPLGEDETIQCMVILRDFPYNSALFGLVK